MRTLDVIEYVVAFGNGAVAKDIAAGLDIPLSSLSYLLATLTERGYLAREGRRYLPGPSLERMRSPVTSLTLAERMTPIVRALTAELNETASFMVRDGWTATIVVTSSSAQALRYAIEPGERKPLHTLAGGKAMLTMLSDDELSRYFAETTREYVTERTIVDEAELRADLARARSDGFAVAIEESTPGICSIGTPVALPDGTQGAISIAVPSIRFDPALVDKARRSLSRARAALGA